jgi:hypothetical protein
MTDAERDEILRDIAPVLRDLRDALPNFALQMHEVRRLGQVSAKHEERISVLETQVLAGVHGAPADLEIPIDVEEPRIDHLFPPPAPIRPPMSTHESINALRLETAKQTPLLARTAETNAKIVETTQEAIKASRDASARWAGAFVAALLLALSQNCSVAHLLPHHAPPPDTQTSAPVHPADPRAQ